MLEEYQETQQIAYKILKNAIDKDKISHAYLFETNDYGQAFNLVLSFAKALLCPNKYTNNHNCVNCTQCQNIDKNCFSELKIIRPDGLWIKKEQLNELQQEFSMKSVESDKKVYIIDGVDRLNIASANTILKFLEEPEPNIVAILITNNIYQVMDTIVSRCQIVSLKKNKEQETTIYEKINNRVKLPEDITEENIQEKIDYILNFVKFFENKKLDALLFTNKMWHDGISGKEANIFALEIMLLYYKDILNYKMNRAISVFDGDKNIESIANVNEIENINYKIKTIIDTKDKIKYNANSALLIDAMIIDLTGGVK